MVFGSIRSLAAFRLTGSTKDYAIVGSDSGRITFGKSGARRIVPGQYLATDPKGRSVMIAAVEKRNYTQKQRYYSTTVVGVDVGFENPLFAALEVDYSESDRILLAKHSTLQKTMLTYYELDLGLNHVVRKWSEPTDPRANLLVQVPGGQVASSDRFDGPSGVLVCCEDHIIYRHMDRPQHRVPIPRRNHPLEDPAWHHYRSSCHAQNEGLSSKTAQISLHNTRIQGAFFFLLQSEDGDLFKVTIDHEEDEVKALKVKYFDTVPVASSLCILKSGFLFVVAEFVIITDGSLSHLYQFQKLGDDDDEPEFSSTSYPADELESLDPIMDSKVMNVLPNSDTPQIFAACGRGSRSTFRMLRHDEFDSYIILSFVNGTLVLSIGETIEEVQDTGFLSSAPTLAVQQIGADALLQVHPHGIRHVLTDRRVVVALSSAELVYFELDLDGQLNEYQDRKAMGSTVLALSIAEVPEGRQRTPYLAVGCEDQTVRIISLDPENTLETISLQALTAPPSAICIADMLDASINKAQPTTFVNIGLQNGVLLRTVLDPINGQLTDTRTRFLGTRPIKLLRVQIEKSPAILALSSRSWLNYTHQNLMHFTPLIFENLDYAWSFSAELSPEVIIFQIPKLGMKLKQDAIQLSCTPRKFISHPTNRFLYLIEGDHRVLGEDAINRQLAQLRQAGKPIDEEVLRLPSEVFGRVRAPAGTWASAIRIIDPVEAKTVGIVHLDNNEAAFCLAVVPFAARGGELHLVVGTAGFLRTYTFTQDGTGLELLHKTELDDVPLAIIAFQGRLVAGVGKALRLYEMGKKKLLRKVENKTFSSPIVTLNTQGSRILVGDMQDSIFMRLQSTRSIWFR
ncbi:CPSF A subunit region-domain-containing protein [Pisolithus croceorrhizus]|nr:CPSF A subunit region-domain-containing protein [Pisolithus croceorrhizus]